MRLAVLGIHVQVCLFMLINRPLGINNYINNNYIKVYSDQWSHQLAVSTHTVAAQPYKSRRNYLILNPRAHCLDMENLHELSAGWVTSRLVASCIKGEVASIPVARIYGNVNHPDVVDNNYNLQNSSMIVIVLSVHGGDGRRQSPIIMVIIVIIVVMFVGIIVNNYRSAPRVGDVDVNLQEVQGYFIPGFVQQPAVAWVSFDLDHCQLWSTPRLSHRDVGCNSVGGVVHASSTVAWW